MWHTGPRHRVTVVVMTRNRRESLASTLRKLTADELTADHRPAGPGEVGHAPVVVVDNGSTDGSPDLVADGFPGVRLVTLPTNVGAVARNIGAELARTSHVAFADDDSWWAPGALARAADVLDEAPRLGLLVAQVRLPAVEDGTGGAGTGSAAAGGAGAVDPASRKAARGVLGREPDLPGPSVAGFPACAAVVRRSAFLAVGGFSPLLGFGGEEELLSLDLAAAGWGQAHVADVVALHAPSTGRQDGAARWALQQRNSALTAWLRLPVRTALRASAELGRTALTDRTVHPAVLGLLARLPGALAGRRPVPSTVATAHKRAGRPLA